MVALRTRGLHAGERVPVQAPVVRRDGDVHVRGGRPHALVPGERRRIVRVVKLHRRHGRPGHKHRPVVRQRLVCLAHVLRRRLRARRAVDHERRGRRLWALALPQEVEQEAADGCEGHDATGDAACDCARV